MASNITTTSTASQTSQQSEKPSIALRAPSDASDSSRDSEISLQPQNTSTAQPYDKLLMPEPASENLAKDEQRREGIRYFNCLLFRGKRNKDWHNIPAVDDEVFDEPLTPLPSPTV